MKYLFISIIFFTSVSLTFSQSQKQNRNSPVKIIFDGEVYKSYNYQSLKNFHFRNYPYNPPAYNTISFTMLSTLRNYYDLQSNASPLQIWQDPNNPDNIHAVYTYSSEITGWSDRTIQYYFSSDRGATWSYLENVGVGGRSGFGTIAGLSTGCALIGLHSNAGGGVVRAQFYADAFPGLGSFTRLDPGSSEDSKHIWPRVVSTANISQSVKYVFVVSTNNTIFDSTFYNTGNSISSSAFSGYKQMPSRTAESYALARGSDGRIGIAYMAPQTNVPSLLGDVYFTETTNNGATFSTPIRIFDSNFNTDSLAGLRGISMVYKSNSPCVVFEADKQDGEGGYFPYLPSQIKFWSPAVNGGNTLVIADENNVPFVPAVGTTDNEAPVCKPTIGISGDGSMLFCSMVVQSATVGGEDSTNFNDIYLARSSNSGSNWTIPERITPISPRNDWSFASISQYNDYNASSYFVNLMVQRDTIPGSNVNYADSRTFARAYAIRVSYSRSTTPPAVPTLLTPANNATNQSLNPVLTWTSTGDSYRLQISTTAGFTNIILDQSNIAGTSFQVPSPILTSNTTYYWRVQATNSFGSSAFTSGFAFTTTSQTLPSAPSLISPANGAVNQSTLPSFDWSDVSNANTYRIQVSTNNTFTGIVFDSSNVTVSQITMPFSLSGNTQYYWRVNAKNNAGTSAYSSIFSFTTAPLPPAAPTLISPPNGQQGVSLTPNMLWTTSNGASSYHIQIATDLNFNNIVYQALPTGTSHTVPSGNLALNTLYFWRVRGNNVSGFGPYSSVYNFRSTMVNVFNNIAGVIPTEYKLYNNYPNPFNPVTKIKFDLPKTSDVKIRIFDLNGKTVSEITDYGVSAGTYETIYNASNLASGIYYFKIEAGEFNDTKKMMLIK